MKILTKKLMPAEIKCRCLVLPRGKKGKFPSPGVDFDILEGKTTHRARLDSQFRLRAPSWFRQHQSLKPGDEITFSKDNGTMKISLSRYFSKPEDETFKWAGEILDAIRDNEMHGHIEVGKNRFSVEFGQHIRETQIIFTAK